MDEEYLREAPLYDISTPVGSSSLLLYCSLSTPLQVISGQPPSPAPWFKAPVQFVVHPSAVTACNSCVCTLTVPVPAMRFTNRATWSCPSRPPCSEPRCGLFYFCELLALHCKPSGNKLKPIQWWVSAAGDQFVSAGLNNREQPLNTCHCHLYIRSLHLIQFFITLVKLWCSQPNTIKRVGGVQ